MSCRALRMRWNGSRIVPRTNTLLRRLTGRRRSRAESRSPCLGDRDKPKSWPPRQDFGLSLSPKHGERDSARLLRLPVRRRSNVLVRGTIRDPFQRIRNARQLIHDLVAHRRPLHDHGAPPAELLHRPGGRRDDENYDREKLFTTCDSDRPAKKVKNMIREQIFLPAGAESNDYLIGCHFGADCQPHSQSHRERTKSKSRRRAFLTFGPPCFAVESQGFES